MNFINASFVVCLLSSSMTFAQAPDTLWTKTFGGIANDAARSAQQTTDGGYILAGYTHSFGAGNRDAWAVKTDANANVSWQKTIGGTLGDDAHSIQQTADGGYVMAATSNSFSASGDDDMWLVKINSIGNVQWDKRFGGALSEEGKSAQQTSDGGYVIAGSTRSAGAGALDVYLVKTDGSGNMMWERTFGGAGGDEGSSVLQTNDGGYVIAGYGFGTSSTGVMLVKTDPNGNVQWQRVFERGAESKGRSVQQTVDGGYIITGYTVDVGTGDFDVWLIKTDSSGNMAWDRTFGGNGRDEGWSVRATTDGGYIVAGFSLSFGSSFDSWLIKTDAVGNMVWDKTYGGGSTEVSFSLQQTNDGGYVVAGSSDSFGAGGTDAWLIRVKGVFSLLSPTLNERWTVGQQDTIRWNVSQVDGLQLDYSTDDGASYQLIDFFITTGDSFYVWQVPEDIRTSSRCRIRISDLLDSTRFAVSEQFTIKAYDLVRVMPDSTLDPFHPNKHGWRYQNSSSVMWPSTWWPQFNYQSGTDPFNNSYPDRFTSKYNAMASDFPDWPLWVSAFGADQCYYSTFLGIFKERADRRWSTKSKSHNGSCYGFATSSLLAFRYGQLFMARYRFITQTDSIHTFIISNNIRSAINEYYIHQFGKTALLNDRVMAPTDPRTLLGLTKRMFEDENIEPSALSFFNIGGSGAHTVMPYFLSRDASSPSRFRLFVYDSNSPSSSQPFIYIDSLANTWVDSTGLGWGPANAKCYLEPTIDAFLQTPRLSRLVGSTDIKGDSSFVEIYAPAGINVTLVNSGGATIGHVDSIVFNTLTGGIPIIPKTGYEDPPLGFFVPEDRYAVTLTDFPDSLGYLTVISDERMYDYRRKNSLAGETDRLMCADGLGVVNPDNVVKNIVLESMILADSSERAFEVSNISISQNDSLHIESTTDARVRLMNVGNARSYDLSVRSASTSALDKFEHSGISLAANSTHLILPVWSDLLQEPVKILIDLGNDGTIDDSILVNNQTTGIDDQLADVLPQRFALMQNYPNPFNPTTTIRFSVPTFSFVEMKVFDLLGREVTTLMNDNLSPGNYDVVWNGTDNAGRLVASGVYLYRLQVGSFVETRKLVLTR